MEFLPPGALFYRDNYGGIRVETSWGDGGVGGIANEVAEGWSVKAFQWPVAWAIAGTDQGIGARIARVDWGSQA